MGLANQSFDLREDDPLNNSQLNNSRVPLHQPTPTSKPDIIEVQIIFLIHYFCKIDSNLELSNYLFFIFFRLKKICKDSCHPLPDSIMTILTTLTIIWLSIMILKTPALQPHLILIQFTIIKVSSEQIVPFFVTLVSMQFKNLTTEFGIMQGLGTL